MLSNRTLRVQLLKKMATVGQFLEKLKTATLSLHIQAANEEGCKLLTCENASVETQHILH